MIVQYYSIVPQNRMHLSAHSRKVKAYIKLDLNPYDVILE